MDEPPPRLFHSRLSPPTVRPGVGVRSGWGVHVALISPELLRVKRDGRGATCENSTARGSRDMRETRRSEAREKNAKTPLARAQFAPFLVNRSGRLDRPGPDRSKIAPKHGTTGRDAQVCQRHAWEACRAQLGGPVAEWKEENQPGRACVFFLTRKKPSLRAELLSCMLCQPFDPIFHQVSERASLPATR
jgi:hypothetical protein